jgi:hypothetical protein
MSKTYKPCECRAIFAYTVTKGDTPENLTDGDDPAEIVSHVYQSCGSDTTRTFAPGHDAKLKSALIIAHRAGMDYSWTDDGFLNHVDPLAKAIELGWAHFLTDAPAKPARKRSAKPKAAKVTKPGFHPVRVKIGRWTYDAAVEAEDVNEVTVSYRDGKGNLKTATVKRSQLVG